MRILIFGATGPTGLLLIREALSVFQNCTVVAYVRSPDKIPADLAANPSVIVIGGELGDIQAISKAMEGVEVVLSALGPSTTLLKGPFYPSGAPLAKALTHIMEIMVQFKVTRLIVLGTASITDPADKFDLSFSVLVNGVATVARNAYKEFVAIGKTIREHGAGLDWTIARVPLLNSKETKEVKGGFIGDGHTGTSLSRAGFAAFVIHEVEKPEWVKKAPLICTP